MLQVMKHGLVEMIIANYNLNQLYEESCYANATAPQLSWYPTMTQYEVGSMCGAILRLLRVVNVGSRFK